MPTLQDGRDAIGEGNLQQARLIFEAILQEEPRSADAWLGLAEVLTDTEDKRICYDNVLKIDSNNRAAREGLRNLAPEADPLVAALAQQAAPEPEEDEDELDFMMEDDEPTLVSTQTPDLNPAADAEGGPSVSTLVILGLGLAVVVFAVGGGVLYLLLTSLTGG